MALINEDPAPRRVLYLHGLGGHGKSLLLRYLAARCCVRLPAGEWDRARRLPDAEVPTALARVAKAAPVPVARIDFGARPVAVFAKYQEKVTAHAADLPPLPDPAGLREVVNNEAIVHQDDMLDFAFLGQGTTAGSSVAKLLVPRFEGGAQIFDAAGRPVLYYGTGWLAAPDLVVTNHHVINARQARSGILTERAKNLAQVAGECG